MIPGLPRGGLSLALTLMVLLSCASRPGIGETPLPVRDLSPGRSFPSVRGEEEEEIRRLIEAGLPSSLYRALELLQGRELGDGDFRRVMAAVAAALLQRLYAVPRDALPSPEPPPSQGYTRILQDVERGIYRPPPPDSEDFLEHILPFLALWPETRPERLREALDGLEIAGKLRPQSVLVPWFKGLVLERSGDGEAAGEEYRRAGELAPGCYPVFLGLARTLNAGGRKEEARAILEELEARYAGDPAVKRQLALTYYANRDWARVEPLAVELLGENSRDGEFILILAHVLMEQGQPGQAQPLLDQYAPVNPRHPLYLFLRARLQAEVYRNREGALGFIRTLLEASAAAPEEALIYAARLLMESSREEDRAQGRELLGRLLRGASRSPELISLALQDAIRREDWQEGRDYAVRLLEERRSPQDLFYAYTVERGLGNSGPALAYAEECYRLAPDNDEWAAAYIAALIEEGRRNEAVQMIESRLSRMAPGPLKGRYYYLRSQLRNDEETAINDLRSGLFEDPRNLSALIALFEIYHRRGDERRAVYYLKQALAIAPMHPLLRSYEGDYASLLGEAGPLRGSF